MSDRIQEVREHLNGEAEMKEQGGEMLSIDPDQRVLRRWGRVFALHSC